MITKEQFGLWKHDPVTKWVFEFLKGKQEFMKNAALEQWVGGSPWPETVRGQIIELDEIVNIDRSSILEFYGIEEKQDDGTDSEGSQR